MRFCAFHFDKTLCTNGFPTTSGTVYVWWVILKLVSNVSKEPYEETNGTFDCMTIDYSFERFSTGGDES